MKTIYLAAFAAVAFAGAADATTYRTIDLNPIDGTSWSTFATTPVRLDFGPRYGAGTVTMTTVNNGYIGIGGAPVPHLPYYQYTAALGNGDTLISEANGTAVFNTYSNSGLSGGMLTFTLDSGEFLPGTLFTIGSLDLTASRYQYFSPGAGFGAPDSASLPSDGVAPLSIVGGDADGVFWGNALMNSVSETRAFGLDTASNSFSVRVLGNPGRSGGMSFSVAVADVPEPATWAMLITGFGLVGASMRRKRAALA